MIGMGLLICCYLSELKVECVGRLPSHAIVSTVVHNDVLEVAGALLASSDERT